MTVIVVLIPLPQARMSAQGARGHIPSIAAPHARRSARLVEIQRHPGLALGGAAGAQLVEFR